MSILFIDVETTGLPGTSAAAYQMRNNWPQVQQLAYIISNPRRGSGGVTVKKALLKISQDVSEGAQRTHGISREMCNEKGVSPKALYKQLMSEIKSEGVQHIVAHNIQFDVKVICNNMYELCRMKDEAWKLSRIPTVCTMKFLTPHMKLPMRVPFRVPTKRKQYKFPKLSEAAKFLNVDVSRYKLHDASSDVQILYKVFKRINKKYGNLTSPQPHGRAASG